MFRRFFNNFKEWLADVGVIELVREAYDKIQTPDEQFFKEFIPMWWNTYSGSPKWAGRRKGGINADKSSATGRHSNMRMATIVCAELATLCFSEEAKINVSSDWLERVQRPLTEDELEIKRLLPEDNNEPTEAERAVTALVANVSGQPVEDLKDTTIEDKDLLQVYVDKVLERNGFYDRFRENIEYTMALGGGCVKIYTESGQIKLGYVTAMDFVPTAWDNQSILEGVFITQFVRDKMYYTLFERRTWETREVDDKTERVLYISHKLYVSDKKDVLGKVTKVTSIFPELQSGTFENTDNSPLFAYYRPNIANTKNPNSPLGISVFDSALDTLRALDIAFDSLYREFKLGKKRVIVPAKALRYVIDPQTGQRVRYFDADDEAYVAFNIDEWESLKIVDNTVELRIEEHTQGINALLNILCMQCGLSFGSFTFDVKTGVKTAREVISQDSKTHRTKRDHQNLIQNAIVEIVKAIVILGKAAGDIPPEITYETNIYFDDSIIVDVDTDIDRAVKLTGGTIISKYTALTKYLGFSRKEAKAELVRIANESRVTQTDIDFFGLET